MTSGAPPCATILQIPRVCVTPSESQNRRLANHRWQIDQYTSQFTHHELGSGTISLRMLPFAPGLVQHSIHVSSLNLVYPHTLNPVGRTRDNKIAPTVPEPYTKNYDLYPIPTRTCLPLRLHHQHNSPSYMNLLVQ